MTSSTTLNLHSSSPVSPVLQPPPSSPMISPTPLSPVLPPDAFSYISDAPTLLSTSTTDMPSSTILNLHSTSPGSPVAQPLPSTPMILPTPLSPVWPPDTFSYISQIGSPAPISVPLIQLHSQSTPVTTQLQPQPQRRTSRTSRPSSNTSDRPNRFLSQLIPDSEHWPPPINIDTPVTHPTNRSLNISQNIPVKSSLKTRSQNYPRL